MSQQILTREFSICLLPDSETTDQVSRLRDTLPESPYRDDIPHITLLRGISSSREMSDEALVQEIGSLLSPSDHLPLTATVRKIENRSNQHYSLTGAMTLDASKDLLAYRADVAATLSKHRYSVEQQELNEYTPHITIRLGIPLEGDDYRHAQGLFENKVISFSQWLLFRLVLIDGKRAMHEVRPNVV